MVLNRQCGRICRKKKRLSTDEPAVSHADELVLVFNLRPIRIVDIGLDLISICLGFRSASLVFSVISRQAAASAVSSSSIPPPCGHLRLLPLRPRCGTAGAPSRQRRASARQRRLLPYQIISEARRTCYGAGGWLYRLSVSDRYDSMDDRLIGHATGTTGGFQERRLIRLHSCANSRRESSARRTAQRSFGGRCCAGGSRRAGDWSRDVVGLIQGHHDAGGAGRPGRQTARPSSPAPRSGLAHGFGRRQVPARAGRRRTGARQVRCPRLSHRAADRRPRVRIMCPPLNTSH